MTPLTSLLAATDLSIEGNNAVRRAALLAHEHGARLHILHVLRPAGHKPLRDWFQPSPDADLKVAQARATLRHLLIELTAAFDLTVSVEVIVGDTIGSLMRASDQVDLVLLGWPADRRFAGLLPDGTVNRMIRRCRRPVLVVKAAAQDRYRTVLVPVDFKAPSDAAMHFAGRMRLGAGLHVFHASDSRREAVLRDADVPEHVIRVTRLMEEGAINARMRRWVAGLGLDSNSMSYALAYGSPARATLTHARGLGADLIVAGRRSGSVLGRFLHRSVSSHVLSQACCDMLIVPGSLDCSPPMATEAGTPQVLQQPLTSAHLVDDAVLIRSGTAHAEAGATGHWMRNEPRFVSRRSS